MPIYEYRCGDCRELTSVFLRSRHTDPPSACSNCGGVNLKRLMSRLSRVKSAGQVMDEVGMPEPGGAISDPRQIGRWVEKRFADYGMDVPSETREMIDAARDGELPDEIADI